LTKPRYRGRGSEGSRVRASRFKRFKNPLIIFGISPANTNALSKMLKRVQHDKKKCVIPNLFRNLEFGNDNKSIAFVLLESLNPGPLGPFLKVSV